jgi:diguanylate cyclase (GGDEF)-like protein/PAS domain S-box-containing protein
MQLGPLSNLWQAHKNADLSIAQELSERVRLEQVALLYRNSNVGFVVSIAAGALLVVTLRSHVSIDRLMLWYGLLLLVTLARYSLTQRYQDSDLKQRRSRDWETLFLMGTGVAGFVWGLSILMLFPADSVAHQFFIALVLAGMVGGSMAVFSARKTVYILFAFTILIPVILRFLYEGDAVHTMLAFMVIVYLTGMILTANNTERMIRIALALRFDNQELSEQIAQRKRTELALRDSEERFRDFTDSAADFFWELDAQLCFTDVSERFHEITGLNHPQVLGRTFTQILTRHCKGCEGLSEIIRLVEDKSEIDDVELTWRISETNRHSLLFSGKPIFDKQGVFQGYRGVGRDVTNERQITQLMHHQAKHDALTGLVNRREFIRRLENALVHSKRDGTPCVLCYLDLDQFKIVNDTVGHTAGDELLKELSGLLYGRLRTRDTLSRVGGDEFALLLESCHLEDGIRVAETLLAVLAGFRFHWETREFQIGASIGIVPISAETDTALQVLSQADLACYTAKDLGRNRIHVYHAGDVELTRLESQMAQVSGLQVALKNDRFQLYQQPICALEDGRVEHYELLLRLHEETPDKILSPRSFIPAAERYGMMKEVDRWVIQHALSVYAQRFGESSDIAFSINLSGNSLNDESLLPWINQQLKHYQVPPSRICFEVTETAAIRNLNQAKQLIEELKTRGCRFALDDFGSGLSSFAYIKYLPVDYLKIDGSFVADLEHDPTANAMVSAINEMGHVLGMKTVAEHVENDTTLELIRQIGVDYVQGYALGKPTPLLGSN